jgi:hypothetical protein
MINKMFRKLITKRRVMKICITHYGEVMKNNTFTDMMSFSDQVRNKVRDEVKVINPYTELGLDTYVSDVIIEMFDL